MKHFSNQCPNSVGIFNVEGYHQVYPFCLHEIKVEKTDIKISGLNPNKKLNDFGKGPFCKFSIDEHLNEIGLYCFVVDDELKYIGQTVCPFKKRINDGYGTIYPYNCYADGQRTNCHINSLVNEALLDGKEIRVGFYPMNDEMDALESELIEANNLTRSGWNLKK